MLEGRCVVPGNPKFKWNGVSMAKYINPNEIPPNMNIDNEEVDNCNLAEAFTEYFDKNITTIVNSFKVGQDIYNGNKKLTCINQNFINQTNLMKALDSIKIKKTLKGMIGFQKEL